MLRRKQTKVTLVGAGPGDPDLISVAGVKALKDADVVLYDALVHPDVLKWSPNAQLIFVGKRKGFKRLTQESINYLMLSEAMEGKSVVRLKGGDPFIFGRGQEELQFLNAFGVDVAVIPGISSATSASITQGISLTKRDVSQSFYVITGTTKENKLSKDIAIAAQSSATIVILMGMSKLQEIAEIFKSLGKSKLAVSIIQNAYMPQQKSVTATIDCIVEKVEHEGISNPAVIVIGEVVNHAVDKLSSLTKLNRLKQ